jgi:hypothetical protein
MKRKPQRPTRKSRTRTSKRTRPPRRTRRTHRIRIPAANGTRTFAARSARDASLAGKYWNAVHLYVARGDASALEPFIGVQIAGANGRRVLLLTDLRTLDRLAGAGVLSFESIYARRI